ncbi:MAG: YkgJ family cysteine cluster protein [Desulfobulbus sp.]|jgi:Fe-S-cluster containining protein|nr:MAG: YkgJ family cysteine cluster protein [Desulfobulbus sp.]
MNYCNYCPGYCCYRLEGSMLLLSATDINRLARHLRLSDGEIRRRYLENKNTFKVKEDGSCIFQAPDRMSKRCTVHEARPDQCRNFPYDKPCPYLKREDLLAEIAPRIEQGLRRAWGGSHK